jgi:hypothetical protein
MAVNKGPLLPIFSEMLRTFFQMLSRNRNLLACFREMLVSNGPLPVRIPQLLTGK